MLSKSVFQAKNFMQRIDELHCLACLDQFTVLYVVFTHDNDNICDALLYALDVITISFVVQGDCMIIDKSKEYFFKLGSKHISKVGMNANKGLVE